MFSSLGSKKNIFIGGNSAPLGVFWNLKEAYEEKYFYFIINPHNLIYESRKPGAACLCVFCWRTFCAIVVKLKHEYQTIRDWTASQTNTNTVQRRRRSQGAWPREVGGVSSSSAGTLQNSGCRPPGAQHPDGCSTSKDIPAFLRAPITAQQCFLCFYFIYCLNTLTRRIHHRCKHTENFNTIYCESSSRKSQVGNTEEGRL